MSELSNLLRAADEAHPMTTRQRADRIGNRLHFGTISDYLSGRHAQSPTAETLRLLAEAFELDLAAVQAAAAVPVGAGAWEVPAEITQLSLRQQAAITELIRAIAEGGGQDASPAPKKHAGGSPADPGARMAP